jgi:hypothetical protein
LQSSQERRKHKKEDKDVQSIEREQTLKKGAREKRAWRDPFPQRTRAERRQKKRVGLKIKAGTCLYPLLPLRRSIIG